MAAGAQTTKIAGYCVMDFNLLGREYRNINSNIMICVTDMILGTDFQEQHESVVIKHKWQQTNTNLLCPYNYNVNLPTFFANLSTNCKPIANQSVEIFKAKPKVH